MSSSNNQPPYRNDAENDSQDMDALQQNPDSALEGFFLHHSQPGTYMGAPAPPKLLYPVVIPQRRPGNKERGFVKAYAPDLQAFGIDQDIFLEFIKATNKVVQASKWLYAIQVAAMGTGLIPNHIALGVSAAVQIVAGVVAKTETRWKTNSFMDRANSSFFQPRGLYCLLMSYSPVATDKKEKVDPTQALLDRGSSAGSGMSSKAKRNLRNPLAGVTQGQESLPDSVATLVYPTTENLTPEANKKKRAFTRLNEYFDQRAQARYAAESKGDVLSSTPQKPFSNRYLDPNHPASNGGLLGLLSGGKLTPDLQKQKESMRATMASQEQAVRDQQASQMANLSVALQGMGLTAEEQQSYIEQYENAYEAQLQQFQQQSELLESGQRRITRHILYLMIVNMPTAEEIEAARNRRSAGDIGQVGNDVEIVSVNVE